MQVKSLPMTLCRLILALCVSVMIFCLMLDLRMLNIQLGEKSKIIAVSYCLFSKNLEIFVILSFAKRTSIAGFPSSIEAIDFLAHTCTIELAGKLSL